MIPEHRYTPSFKDFCTKARLGNLVPVYREIMADFETPVTAFLKIRKAPYAYLLESVEGGEKWARYSFLGTEPAIVIKGRQNKVEIIEGKKKTLIDEPNDLMSVLRDTLKRFKPVEVEGLPRFFGGAVGFMSYETVRYFEQLPDYQKSEIEAPDIFFLITDTLLIFDNVAQKIKVVSNASLDGVSVEEAYRRAVRKIDSLIKRLRKPIKQPRRKRSLAAISPRVETSNLKRDEFETMVDRAKDYIRAGDVIQVVLSQRIETSIRSSAFDVYRSLRTINPSPYMYYLELENISLVGSSPEVLVRREDSHVEVRPIAGTRKRGSTEDEDKSLDLELRYDEKERAEHIMLVDLGRNDLGRISKVGSVVVKELMTVERYSHVMHLVSHVVGQLEEGLDSFDVIKACFPAGTVTGAPKIRAMEIIEELEPTKRGTYAGAVGYFSFSENLDACINIRTIMIVGDKAYIQAGAGIVADSDPSLEYQETVNKAKGMLAAIDFSERGFE